MVLICWYVDFSIFIGSFSSSVAYSVLAINLTCVYKTLIDVTYGEITVSIALRCVTVENNHPFNVHALVILTASKLPYASCERIAYSLSPGTVSTNVDLWPKAANDSRLSQHVVLRCGIISILLFCGIAHISSEVFLLTMSLIVIDDMIITKLLCCEWSYWNFGSDIPYMMLTRCTYTRKCIH